MKTRFNEEEKIIIDYNVLFLLFIHAGQCYVKAAPDELLLQIFSYLQATDLCRVAQVCSRFSVVCKDESLW